ncbi:MAG TPA: type II toxin-antitoxin system RelE/ParE family toxin [Cyclobacteriaceae bacterium]|nr:type II toxin-antitoxin system RelE/ParE family toxin [Cyclobacteriaceae bacterium]
MNHILEITKEAKLDIEEAWLWYEEIRTGLGEDFLLSLEAALNQLKRQPLLYEIKHKEVRVCLLKRFPYKVIYFLDNDKVIVLAVFHSHRNPETWKERVK